ncbi:MAG: hypothetical protein ACYC6F_03685 [Longimicrobiales bacterium]
MLHALDHLDRLEALRWLDRVTYHVWRRAHHLAVPGDEGADHLTETCPEAED